ncbi:MAG: iron-containing alcohol dehydrogenase [Acholeplasmatales bacterium]|nr:iron-containing alcohol dehydrogenase [Acholeplasmatales bacterium]
MINFIYNTPTKIFFGKGEEDKIGSIVKEYGFKKIMLHYGKGSVIRSGLLTKVKAKLDENGIEYVELGGVDPNPKLSLVLKGVELAKKEKVELILAIGGGSVLDSAKSIAVGAKVDFSPWEFSIKNATPKDHIPVASILTIAAAGSDMSNSCVITNDETNEKRGFTSELNRCLFSVLNPELTYTVSKFQTGCGIVDTMMHTLERYFSVGPATELTDNIALGLLKAVYDAGKVAIKEPENYDARAELMWANSLSHNGLTGAGRPFVMSVHQIEHEVSGMYPEIAHGAGLAALWPQWAMKAYKACPDRFLRFSYEVMGITPTDNKTKDIEDGIQALKTYFKELDMPVTLHELGVKEDTLEALAYNTMFKGKRVLKDIITVDYDMALQILKDSF